MGKETINVLSGIPSFEPVEDHFSMRIAEGPRPVNIGFTRLPARNGSNIQERCKTAWERQDEIALAYLDRRGRKRELPVVAVRTEEKQGREFVDIWVQLDAT